MEIKKIFNRWTIGLNTIGIVFNIILFSNPRDSLGLIIIFPVFFGFVVLVGFIHSFWFEKFRDKLIIGLVDLVPMLLLSILLGIQDSSGDFLIAFFITYLIPGIIIPFLSLGITALWRKFKK